MSARSSYSLLMKQTLTEQHEAVPGRAARRRLERAGYREPPAVRIIRLRRIEHAPGGHEDREYHVRWIVRGHWRNQWFPARQLHRPVWIAPHLKGPADAPLIGGEKVNVWNR
jgi:hypothetical protein